MNPLFANPLNRAELLALPDEAAGSAQFTTMTVAVHRNHSFELTAAVMNKFLALCRVRAKFMYSDYDDSLSFLRVPAQASVHVLWLDAARYAMRDFPAWLQSRVLALQKITADEGGGSKILIACCGAPGLKGVSLPDTLTLDCDAVLAPLGDDAYDLRLEAFSGTRLSNQACLVLARELGSRQIPALLFPPLKALVLDLDNTLHQGVLGEDGPGNGIGGVTPCLALQAYLADLGRQGFLLALASRNEEEDVRRLFTERKDFPLRWEDFSAHAIGWGAKSEGVERIAAALRIGLDSILFVDDNPGERLEVGRGAPDVHVLPASCPEEMLAALRYYPGLYKTNLSPEDTLRGADIKANARREKLRQRLGPEEYLAKLGISFTFSVNRVEQAARANDLLHKTNQFTLALKRPSEAEVAAYFSGRAGCVITASMQDSLSDSGLIAVGLFAAEPSGRANRMLRKGRKSKALCLNELAVSCRALGRGVEDGMIRAMIRLAAKTLHAGPGVEIAYVSGPRNKPALMWLQSLTGDPLAQSGTVVLDALPLETLCAVHIRVE